MDDNWWCKRFWRQLWKVLGFKMSIEDFNSSVTSSNEHTGNFFWKTKKICLITEKCCMTKELKFTCSFYQKIALVYDSFPSSTNKLGMAFLLEFQKFKYFLNHFWWQYVIDCWKFHSLCFQHFENCAGVMNLGVVPAMALIKLIKFIIRFFIQKSL